MVPTHPYSDPIFGPPPTPPKFWAKNRFRASATLCYGPEMVDITDRPELLQQATGTEVIPFIREPLPGGRDVKSEAAAEAAAAALAERYRINGARLRANEDKRIAAIKLKAANYRRDPLNNPAVGRPPGRKARAIKSGREAVALFVEMNVDRLQSWLDEIAIIDGPLVAFRCVTEIIEYHIPKLARTEHTGANEGPVEIVFSWRPPEN